MLSRHWLFLPPISYAKQNPGKPLNASSGNGSPGHVGFEPFKFIGASRLSVAQAWKRMHWAAYVPTWGGATRAASCEIAA